MITTCLNIPSSRWNGKWHKILEFSLETQVLILFLLLFSLSFFIAVLDNFIVRKSYQSLDYTNVVFAALKPFLTWILVSVNWGLIQQNPKKYVLIEREKIRKRCESSWKKFKNSSLTLSSLGFFDQPQPGGMNHPPYLKFDLFELGSWNMVCI